MMRVGIGEDIHVLVSGRPLVLGGVNIPFDKGLLGHSDADVVYHALSDALLGSLALGDIGTYFPPDDDRYKGIDSSIILKKCHSLILENGYHIVNADVSIACETPKLAPFLAKMRANLASILECDITRISIKAMTAEGLDAVGEGRAIRSSAIVMIEKEEKQP